MESVFARASKRGLEPVELGRRVVREAERNKKLGMQSELLPNVYELHLAPVDYADLSPVFQAVNHELCELLVDTAIEKRCRFVGGVKVNFVEDSGQRVGALHVESYFLEEVGFSEQPQLVLPGGRRVALGSEDFTIGRMPGCSLVIEDPRVSRNHAAVVVIDGIAYIRDLGSTNGTFVNGQRVTKETPLRSGDDIKVGGSEIAYLIE